MRPTLRILSQLTLASTLATPLNAAQEIQDNVPLDLVKALLASNSPFEIRIYAGLPDNFPGITIPDSVELLGAADMGHSQQVVLRAEGDGIQQRAQIMSSLENLGYLMLTQPPASNLAQTGFVTPMFIPPNMPVQFCHDVHGMVTLRITGSSGGMPAAFLGGSRVVYQSTTPQGVPVSPFLNATPRVAAGAIVPNAAMNSVINVTNTGGANNPRTMGGAGCAQMQAQFSGRGQPGPGMMSLNQYLPRMELPPTAIAAIPGMTPAFTSGPGGVSMESTMVVSLDWDMGRLLAHLTEQVAQQDWENDSETLGNTSATASWVKEIDESRFLGSLRVIKIADSQYRLQFSIQSLSMP